MPGSEARDDGADAEHEDDEYVCDACGTTFASKDELREHLHEQGQLE